MIATYVVDTAGIARPWPREAPVDHLLGVPIRKCPRCGCNFVATTRLCPGCGAAQVRLASPVCRNGHPLIGANVYAHPSGHRRCRICCLARWARYNRDGRYRGHRRVAELEAGYREAS